MTSRTILERLIRQTEELALAAGLIARYKLLVDDAADLLRQVPWRYADWVEARNAWMRRAGKE
jgi:hypothetical protein